MRKQVFPFAGPKNVSRGNDKLLFLKTKDLLPTVRFQGAFSYDLQINGVNAVSNEILPALDYENVQIIFNNI